MIDPMEVAEIRQKLLAMIRERLFGDGPWLADPETCAALDEKLRPFGLDELDPSSRPTLIDNGNRMIVGTLRPTLLGREINVDLMMVFLGMWPDYEVPYILYTNGLISEQEMREALARMDERDELDEQTLDTRWSRPAPEIPPAARLRFYERAAITTVLLPLVRRAFERAERMGLL
jgi:hypothetical protein